jgi:lysophospholipase L1-like esterase
VVLTNAFGSAPLSIGAASVSLRDKDSSIVAGSSHALMFAGKAAVTIPAGGLMISDPVEIAVPAMGDLAIDLFFPAEMLAATAQLTLHAGANQTNYLSAPGNFAGRAEFPVATTPGATPASWYFLSRVEVDAPATTSAIIAFGDSITDGTASTRNTNNRWPDLLFKRLSSEKGATAHAILNEAIAGNRLLSDGILNFGVNALARFDRDVLAQPSATHMVVLEGINDIGMGRAGAPAPSADELIAAHQQMIERAHQHGLKIIGATLTPFEGAAYFTADGETKRQAINAWMRNPKATGPKYDGLIDFDAATRDPQVPTKFNPKYDSGDHLHPNDAGYQAMAASIDLKLFSGKGTK